MTFEKVSITVRSQLVSEFNPEIEFDCRTVLINPRTNKNQVMTDLLNDLPQPIPGSWWSTNQHSIKPLCLRIIVISNNSNSLTHMVTLRNRSLMWNLYTTIITTVVWIIFTNCIGQLRVFRRWLRLNDYKLQNR